MSEYTQETKAFIKAIFSARKDEDETPIKVILANLDAKEHFTKSLPNFEELGVELFVKKEFASIYQKDNALMRFDKSIVMTTNDNIVYGVAIEFTYKNISVIARINNFESRKEALIAVDAELDSLCINFTENNITLHKIHTAMPIEIGLNDIVFLIQGKEVSFKSARKYSLDTLQSNVVCFKKNIYCVRKLFCITDLFKNVS